MVKRECKHMYTLFKAYKKYEIQECINCKKQRIFEYESMSIKKEDS